MREAQQFGSVPGTRFAGVEWHRVIGSTNAELLERARRGAPEGVVLIADLQTAGRGRRGRRWVAPAGTSLMMSVLLRPPHEQLPPSRAALVTLALALAAVDACEQVCGIRPKLKWPNDLVMAASPASPTTVDVAVDDPRPNDLVMAASAESRGRSGPSDGGERKVAGILAESLSSGGRLDAVVAGMGLNTGWPDVPAELAETATSLNLESGAEVDRVLVARLVLEGLERRYARLCRSPAADDASRSSASGSRASGSRGSDPGGVGDQAAGGDQDSTADLAADLLEEARANSATLGRRVRITLDTAEADGGSRALEGLATDLDNAGRLLVVDDSGTTHSVATGDAIHLRAAPHAHNS